VRSSTVYVNTISDAYNFGMRVILRSSGLAFLFLVSSLPGQDKAEQLSILTQDLPAGSLWEPYGNVGYHGVRLSSTCGVASCRWRIAGGVLPHGLTLQEFGELSGVPQESGQFEFTLLVTDSSQPSLEARQKLAINVETPLNADWDRKAQVNGQRIDGAVKVSNRTGRDFDLTFVVLAVNAIGRATAIGYQHFPLKKNTRDLSLPFGDTLSPGDYRVNVDVVGEEPISKKIFRARLVTGKETIAQGP
jgi:Putative Ig domain